MIYVYNRTKEDYSDRENNYPIYRPSILSNPYTHIKDKKTLAMFVVKSRDEAIDRYDAYFDRMYKGNAPFKFIIDEIYEKYKRGEDIYLECYCKPERCHGDIIKEKLEKDKGADIATKTMEEIKELILDDVHRGISGRPASRVDWRGHEGEQFVTEEFNRIILILTNNED